MVALTTRSRPARVGSQVDRALTQLGNVSGGRNRPSAAGRRGYRGPCRADTFHVSIHNVKRPYKMSGRAEAAAATGERIMAAATARLEREYYDDVTLDTIASDAGVTVQTVIRRFGSKEGLVRTIVEVTGPEVRAQRDESTPGDVPGAVRNLMDHYEQIGDMILHFVRQEERVAPFAEITQSGRDFHAIWVERVFAQWLERRAGVTRTRLRAQLIAACDLQTWHLLRRQEGLSRRQAEMAVIELLQGVLP